MRNLSPIHAVCACWRVIYTINCSSSTSLKFRSRAPILSSPRSPSLQRILSPNRIRNSQSRPRSPPALHARHPILLYTFPLSPAPTVPLREGDDHRFDKLWKRACTTADKGESARSLVEILSSKDGRTFALNLEPSEAELCIEILGHVGANPRRSSWTTAHQCNDPGFGGAQAPLI